MTLNLLKNRTVLGLLCIVLSLIVCFGLAPLFNSAVSAQVEIVRMVADVKQGDVIAADMVAAVTVGGYNLPDGVIKETENAIGKFAKYDMQSGDYILPGKLSAAPLVESAYLYGLDGSHEAISVTIKSFAAGLSGKLEAGDIVSLIATDVGDFRETLMPPELRYVKVLAVTDGKGHDKGFADSGDTGADNGGERELPSTVTLLATPTQAVRLAELEAMAQLHCTLAYRGTDENCDQFLQAQADYFVRLEAIKAGGGAGEAEGAGEGPVRPANLANARRQAETAGMPAVAGLGGASDGE